MRIIRNRFIPFPGFRAVNLFGVLFVRKDAVIDRVVINYEEIHTAQMREMLYVPFYLWYVMEWLVRLFMRGNAYRNIGFEREAYANQGNTCYLAVRRHYSWTKYLKRHEGAV